MSKTLLRLGIQFARRCRLAVQGVQFSSPRLLAAQIDCRLGFRDARPGEIQIGPHAWIETGTVLHAYGGSIRIGPDSFLGPHSVIYGHGGVEVGHSALISAHCRILSSNHTVPETGLLIRSQPDILLPTKIGDDVWLGAGVTVLGGVTIGDGCVVGAGAVVTSNLPPYSIAVGVPAKKIRQRGQN